MAVYQELSRVKGGERVVVVDVDVVVVELVVNSEVLLLVEA